MAQRFTPVLAQQLLDVFNQLAVLPPDVLPPLDTDARVVLSGVAAGQSLRTVAQQNGWTRGVVNGLLADSVGWLFALCDEWAARADSGAAPA